MHEMLELLSQVSECQLEQMRKAGAKLAGKPHGYCSRFSRHVRDVEGVVITVYKAVAALALRQDDPLKAAELWKDMTALCDAALNCISAFKDTYAECGTPELYNLILDYRNAADSRYRDNLLDAECLTNPPPNGLLPNLT